MSDDEIKQNDKWLEKFEVTTVGTGEKLSLTPGQIKNLINPKASLQECHVFLNMCRSYGANPFLKDLHLVKYSEKDPAAFVAGRTFFEKLAATNPRFKGYDITLFMNEKGEWSEAFIKNKFGFGEFPLAAKVFAYVEGYEEKKQSKIVYWDECKKEKDEWVNKQKTGKRVLNVNWQTQPATMLEKVGRVRLLRELFSAELGGLYSVDENTGHPDVEETDTAVDAEFEEMPESTLEEGAGSMTGK